MQKVGLSVAKKNEASTLEPKKLIELLTPKEKKTVSRRLRIMQFLSQGKDYEFIRGRLGVGYSTISRISRLGKSAKSFAFMIFGWYQFASDCGIDECLTF